MPTVGLKRWELVDRKAAAFDSPRRCKRVHGLFGPQRTRASGRQTLLVRTTVRVKGKCKFKSKVKGVGQECPTHTSGGKDGGRGRPPLHGPRGEPRFYP